MGQSPGFNAGFTAAEAARQTRESRKRRQAAAAREAQEAKDRIFAAARDELLQMIEDGIAKGEAHIVSQVGELELRRQIIDHFHGLGYEAYAIGPGSVACDVVTTPVIKISWQHLLGDDNAE